MKTAPKNRFEVRQMTEKEGGGYVVTFPDLPGCMSDGDSIEDAIINAADAENEWLLASEEWDKTSEKTGRFLARMPQWMYKGLQYSAQKEGVSMNTLLISLLAKNLGDLNKAERDRQPIG
jgi:antitoxin HicB